MKKIHGANHLRFLKNCDKGRPQCAITMPKISENQGVCKNRENLNGFFIIQGVKFKQKA